MINDRVSLYKTDWKIDFFKAAYECFTEEKLKYTQYLQFDMIYFFCCISRNTKK